METPFGQSMARSIGSFWRYCGLLDLKVLIQSQRLTSGHHHFIFKGIYDQIALYWQAEHVNNLTRPCSKMSYRSIQSKFRAIIPKIHPYTSGKMSPQLSKLAKEQALPVISHILHATMSLPYVHNFWILLYLFSIGVVLVERWNGDKIVQTTGKIMSMTLESRVLVGEVVEFKEQVELGQDNSDT